MAGSGAAEGAAFGPPSSGNEPRMMIDTDGIAGVQGLAAGAVWMLLGVEAGAPLVAVVGVAPGGSSLTNSPTSPIRANSSRCPAG